MLKRQKFGSLNGKEIMKNRKLLIVLTSLLTIAGVTACGGNTTSSSRPSISVSTAPQTGDTVERIEIENMPTKTTYKAGEKFKSSGLVFTAYYENGFVEEGLTGGDCDGWSPNGPLTEDVTKVTMTFEGFSFDIDIIVEPKTLLGIEIVREPDIKSYELGDSLDLTGLTVGADYEEGYVDNETIYTVTDKDGNPYEQGKVLDKPGEIELFVNVTAGDTTMSDSFTITVFSGITVQAEDIYIDGEQPVDHSYTVITGNNLSLDPNDGANSVVKTDSTFTGTGYIGDINKGMSIEFYIYSDIEIQNADLVLIASSTRTNNAESKMDDMNFNQLFKLYYGEEDDEVWIGDDVVIPGKAYPAAGSATTKWTNWADAPLGSIDIHPGFNKVKLECIGTQAGDDGYGRTPNIDKLEVRMNDGETDTGDYVTSVDIVSEPSKLQYEIGETFDPSGLKFNVNYRNGYQGDTNITPNDGNFSFEPNGPLSPVDDEITLKYKNYTWSQKIDLTIPAVSSVEITSMPNTTKYAKGSRLDLTGLKVKATYENDYVYENAQNYVVKDSEGNIYTNDTILNGTYPNGKLTLRAEIISNDIVKYAEFTIEIFNGYTIEAEDIYQDNITGEKDNYTIITRAEDDSKIKTDANGATCIESITTGSKIDFYAYSDVAAEGCQLVLTAASLDRYPGSEGKVGTYDSQFNKIFKLTVNDQEITVGDDVMIKGRDAVGNESIWFLWTENNIATINLIEGYNKVSLECIGKIKDTNDNSMRSANIDKIDIIF